MEYLASSRGLSSGYAGEGCYYYYFNDQGSATTKLKVVRSPKVKAQLVFGALMFDGIHFSGTLKRAWEGHERTADGPNHDPNDCGQADPFRESASCGTRTVDDKTGPALSQIRDGEVSLSGQTVALTGPFVAKDPFRDCPSDSAYGTELLAAPTRQHLDALEDARVGKVLELSGHERSDSLAGIAWLGDDMHDGYERATVKWTLKIEKVGDK